MQEVTEKEVAEQTVIALTYRFTYIKQFDLVVLMKHGELVEFDGPVALLERDSGFRKLYMALLRSH
jgi:ABC-type multidrug transport system fused ATPase/permease subunit